jgi:hypothetical protein
MTKKPIAFVEYLRVSTVRQGESGLGLETPNPGLRRKEGVQRGKSGR